MTQAKSIGQGIDDIATLLRDAEEIELCSRGHHWIASWHSPTEAPVGTKDGAAGICVDKDGKVVVISTDEISWDFPAGLPEGDEDWEQTLRCEMLEEACAALIWGRGFDQRGLPIPAAGSVAAICSRF